jgi:hypothetical protein
MATPPLMNWLPGIVPGPGPANIGQVDEEKGRVRARAGIIQVGDLL